MILNYKKLNKLKYLILIFKHKNLMLKFIIKNKQKEIDMCN